MKIDYDFECPNIDDFPNNMHLLNDTNELAIRDINSFNRATYKKILDWRSHFNTIQYSKIYWNFFIYLFFIYSFLLTNLSQFRYFIDYFNF